MVHNLKDTTYQQRRLASRQRRQMAATRQQAMAVDRGAFRVKSAEGLEVGTAEDPTGSEIVYGTLTIVGQLNGDGTITWTGVLDQTGPTNLRGPVAITGETGTLTVDAETLLQGLTRILADLQVEAGGQIKVGNVLLTPLGGGRVEVGIGTAKVILDGATGKITAGELSIDPTAGGGAVEFANGASLRSSPGSQRVDLLIGNTRLMLTDTKVSINAPTAIEVFGLPTASSMTDLEWVARHATTGQLFKVPPGMGGPGADDFDWPFSQTTTDPVYGFYGMRDLDGDGTATMHWGQDFSVPGGTPIPAAGAGVVQLTGFDGIDTGRGYFIELSHPGNIVTRYFHLNAASPLSIGESVAKGQTIGYVGTTGNSTGNHLHWETAVDGSTIDPRDFMAAHDTDGI